MKQVQAALGVAASLVALAAYVYFLGGLVLWLRFTAARLPTDDAVRALDSQRLFATGMKALLFEAILLGGVLLIVFVAWVVARWIIHTHSETAAPQRGTEARSEERWNAWIIVLQSVIAGIVATSVVAELEGASAGWVERVPFAVVIWAVLAPMAIRLQATQDRKRETQAGAPGRLRKAWRTAWPRAWMAIRWGALAAAAVVAVLLLAAPLGVGVLVLLVFLLLSRRVTKLPTVDEPRRLVPAVFLLGGGLSLIVVAYMGTPPVGLDRTTVVMNGGTDVVGGYVGQTGEGVFLATCVPNREDPKRSHVTRLEVIAPNQFKRVVVGGTRYTLDYGKDPSLVDLVRYYVNRVEITELLDTVSFDVRDSKLVCGLRHVLHMGGRTQERPGVPMEQRVRVFGAGSLMLSGPHVRPQERHVAEATLLTLPIVPTQQARREIRCLGRIRSKIEVRFRSAYEDTVTKSISVALPRPVAPPPSPDGCSGGIGAGEPPRPARS